MKRGGRDFRTGNAIDLYAYFDDHIDIYQIFPKRWLAENGVPEWIGNSIVNKTTIDSRTNRRIAGAAPSRYLARIESNEGTSPDDLDAILRSHDIDPLALRVDNFEVFFTARFERLLKQIEEATGKPVNRLADGSDNPYFEYETDPVESSRTVRRIMAAGESKVVEFKSTAWKNMITGERDAGVEWAVLKTVAGFMNASGGALLVGVDDNGKAVGIEEDYPVMGSKKNTDGWELKLIDSLNRAIGKTAATDVTMSYADVEGRTIALINVGPAAQPVFATSAKGDKKPLFLVRINSSTHELLGPDILDYQRKRWPA
jgi:hypothetical protein